MNGQVGHPRPAASSAAPSRASVVVPAIAVLLAAVLLVGIALATLGSDTASARTELAEGAGVTATLADGSTTRLAVGDEVPPGATVTAPDGAVLRTRDRDVLLSAGGELTVVDGARQELEAGHLMVDARRGPGVAVETQAAVVTTPEGAVSRVEPGPLLRVGAFAGDPLQVRPVGRRATAEVEALFQVQVAVAGLPSRATPLALTRDALERRLAPDLVAADRALTDLGRTLDSGGEQGPAVLSALRAALPVVAAADPLVRPAAAGSPAAPAVPRSEPALAFLLAAAPAGEAPALLPDDARLADRYTRTRDLRAAGGSWGVVARLVDSSVPAVSGLLDRLLAPLVVVAGGGAPAPSDVLALLLPPAAPPAAGAGSTGQAPPAGGAPPPSDDDTEGPADPPPPSDPPPTDDPVGTVVETVEVVVDTVVGLLPDPPEPLPPVPPVPPLPDEEPALVDGLLAD